MRYPIRELCAQVKGSWTATKRECEGVLQVDGAVNDVTMNFDNDTLTLTDGKNKYVWGAHPAILDQAKYMLYLFKSDAKLAEELNYENFMLLEIKDGKLSVCFVSEPTKLKTFPEKFVAPKDSGCIVFEFVRKK